MKYPAAQGLLERMEDADAIRVKRGLGASAEFADH